MMTERAFLGSLSLGQVAYEKHATLFAGGRQRTPWEQLRPPVRARWETIATAVLEECAGGQ